MTNLTTTKSGDQVSGAGGGDAMGWWVQSLAQAGDGDVVMPGNPAQTGTPVQGVPGGAPGGAPGQPQPQGLFGGGGLLVFVMLFFVVMIISQMMSARREKRRRAEMLGGIAKHDKVQTIGGIIGTVQELRDDEVILKVDENSNTRIRFARSAIQQVIKSSGGAPAAADAPGGAAKAT